MLKTELILFDCDGVLVDSEFLSAEINAHLITAAGFSIDASTLAQKYAGLVLKDILTAIEAESNIPFSAQLLDESRIAFENKMTNELTSIAGVRECVSQLDVPYAICSNSTSASIEAMLKHTKLYDLFSGRIFSAPEVGSKRSKPAPDIYLYAANHYHIDPAHVIVLEDSVHGVTAAKAAGMRVIGFTGGKHCWRGISDALTEAGAETVIARHQDFPLVVQAMNQWQRH